MGGGSSNPRSAGPRVWIVTHAAVETPGRIAGILEKRGLVKGWVRTHAGQAVPREMGDAAGLILMGGPMGIGDVDRHPFLRDEMHLLEDALKRGVPVLGVCLGAQMVAAALGARVERGVAREVGWHRVRMGPPAAEDPMWREAPGEFTAFHWHGDAFELPRGATPLASSERTEHQAFRHGRAAYGVLFHLEVTSRMVKAMTRTFRADVLAAGMDPRAIVAGIDLHMASLVRLAGTVFGAWAGLVGTAVEA